MTVSTGVRRRSNRTLQLLMLAGALLACSPDGSVSTHREQDSSPVRCRATESWSGSITVGRELPAPPTPLLPEAGAAEAPPRQSLEEVEVDIEGGRERVAYAFTGDGTLGWSVRYVAQPLTYGDGHEVLVTGLCVLQLDFTLADATASAQAAPERTATAATGGITEVVTFAPHDGVIQSFVGLRDADPTVTVDQADAQLSVRVGE
ncbi:AMIN-like domain-containing (lipo)protein [Rhodococcus gannanensis]|uniref:AMIN-like domain-containing protein n=1 Tax=Rhodococcus gannanensis TaxID=1960308 RepID=A0ABW4NY32_9NOCA